MIKKLIDNKSKEGEKYERILGGLDQMNAVAQFWEDHPQEIQLLAINGLLEYTQNECFNSDEYDAFVKGLSVIGDAMQECWKERQDKVRQSLPSVSDESEVDGSH